MLSPPRYYDSFSMISLLCFLFSTFFDILCNTSDTVFFSQLSSILYWDSCFCIVRSGTPHTAFMQARCVLSALLDQSCYERRLFLAHRLVILHLIKLCKQFQLCFLFDLLCALDHAAVPRPAVVVFQPHQIGINNPQLL